MKYCYRCGKQIEDNDEFCPYCGAKMDSTGPSMAQATAKNTSDKEEKQMNALELIAFIFMILSCISFVFFLFPLCWMIPMTVIYYKSVKERKPVSVAFKVCTLLFVNLLSGILMLVDEETK